MNIFSIGTYDYETSNSTLVSHLSKTKEDFEKDVDILFKTLGAEVIRKADKDYWLGSDAIVDAVVTGLKEMGYTLAQVYRIEHREASILDTSDEQWKEVLGEDVFQQAVDHNQQLRVSHKKQRDEEKRKKETGE